MYQYPVILEPDDNSTVLVSFADIPWAHSFGEDDADALARAVDALESAFIALIESRDEIPAPSAAEGRPTVTLPPLSAAKVALYQAMRDAGVKKAELGRRLGWHMPQVDRLLDLRHASRLDQLSTALRAVGKEIVLSIQDAA